MIGAYKYGISEFITIRRDPDLTFANFEGVMEEAEDEHGDQDSSEVDFTEISSYCV